MADDKDLMGEASEFKDGAPEAASHPDTVTIDGVTYGVVLRSSGGVASGFRLFDSATSELSFEGDWIGLKLTEKDIERVFRKAHSQEQVPAEGKLNRAQRFLDRELGEKGIAEYYGEPDKIAATVLSLGRQRAWEAYEEVTPNLGETEVRRVGRHIGFDEAWDLFAPLLEAQIDLTNGAEARLDFLEQYRDMLRRSGDSPWDPQLVANDLTHVLELAASELPGRDAELEPRIAAVQPAEPKRTSREDQVAAAAEQVRDDAERGIATAQWIKDLAATYDRSVATVPAEEGSGSSTQGTQSAFWTDLQEELKDPEFAASYEAVAAEIEAADLAANGDISAFSLKLPEKYSGGFADLYAALDREVLSVEPGADTSYEFKRGFFAARAIIEIKMAAKKMTEGEPNFEYGWRSFFEGTDEEYEWLVCYGRNEAEELIKNYQAQEDKDILHNPGSTRLIYSLWKRAKGNPGPWIAVEGSAVR